MPASATARMAAPAAAGRRDQAVDAFVDDQAGEHEQGAAVCLGGKDLGALEAEGEVAAGGTLDEPDDDERHDERACIGEHVRGVGKQSKRVGEDADDHLDRHEGDDQRECDPEPLGVGGRADPVRVPGVAAAGVFVLVAGHPVIVAPIRLDQNTSTDVRLAAWPTIVASCCVSTCRRPRRCGLRVPRSGRRAGSRGATGRWATRRG